MKNKKRVLPKLEINSFITNLDQERGKWIAGKGTPFYGGSGNCTVSNDMERCTLTTTCGNGNGNGNSGFFAF